MNKIVPIITLCLAVLAIILNVIAFVCVIIACSVSQIGLIAIPLAIIGMVAAGFLTPFAYIFRKDVLCKIAFFMDAASLALAVTAVIVGFSAV